MMKKIITGPAAPIATSGNSAYMAWWANNTGNNDEVFLRASTVGDKTFGDKMNQ